MQSVRLRWKSSRELKTSRSFDLLIAIIEIRCFPACTSLQQYCCHPPNPLIPGTTAVSNRSILITHLSYRTDPSSAFEKKNLRKCISHLIAHPRCVLLTSSRLLHSSTRLIRYPPPSPMGRMRSLACFIGLLFCSLCYSYVVLVE